jgi:hypothetical protein
MTGTTQVQLTVGYAQRSVGMAKAMHRSPVFGTGIAAGQAGSFMPPVVAPPSAVMPPTLPSEPPMSRVPPLLVSSPPLLKLLPPVAVSAPPVVVVSEPLLLKLPAVVVVVSEPPLLKLPAVVVVVLEPAVPGPVALAPAVVELPPDEVSDGASLEPLQAVSETPSMSSTFALHIGDLIDYSLVSSDSARRETFPCNLGPERGLPCFRQPPLWIGCITVRRCRFSPRVAQCSGVLTHTEESVSLSILCLGDS